MSDAKKQYKMQSDAATDLLRSEMTVGMLQIHHAFAKPSFALSRWLLIVTGAVAAALFANASTAAVVLGETPFFWIIVLLIAAGLVGLWAVYLELSTESQVASISALPAYGEATAASVLRYETRLADHAQQLRVVDPPPLRLPEAEGIAQQFEYPSTWLARRVFGTVKSNDLSGAIKAIMRTFYRQAVASRLQLILVGTVFVVGLVDVGLRHVPAPLLKLMEAQVDTPTTGGNAPQQEQKPTNPQSSK